MQMQKHFFGILQPELTQGDRGALPALDPQGEAGVIVLSVGMLSSK